MTLTELRSLGLTLTLVADQPRIGPASLLTPELIETIRQNRGEIVSALQAENESREWDERCESVLPLIRMPPDNSVGRGYLEYLGTSE